MGRRRRSGWAEDLFQIAARLPWWGGLIGALVMFAGFRALASIEVPSPTGLDQFGHSFVLTLIRGMANFLQYIVPPVLIAGSIASALASRKRKSLHNSARQSGMRAVADLSWRDFERLIGEAFRQRGFAVSETAAGADGGVDLELRKGGELYLCQCKHWRAQKVGVQVVRELYGVMAARGAAGGFVVTAGAFTADAQEFATGRNVELVDGNTLARWFRPLQVPSQPRPAPAPVSRGVSCPRCGAAMVRRIARKGAHAGEAFLGCSRFPSCRATKPLV